MKRVIPFFLILLVIPCVFSLGIRSEGIEPMVLKPSYTKQVKFYVSDITEDIDIYSKNDLTNTMDLTKYVTFSEIENLENNEKFFIATISFPDVIDESQGGLQRLLIGAREKSHSGAVIGGVAAVQKVIPITVLYPEKIIKTELSVPNINENEEIKALVGVQSWSLQDISSINVLLELYDEKQEKIAEKKSKSFSLKSGLKETVSLSFPSAGLSAGNYRINAIVDYDGDKAGSQKEFRIGSLDLNLVSYSEEIIAGGISKFKITVSSGWNSIITNVYATVSIGGKQFMKTPNYEVLPWQTITLENFLDASSLSPGNYPIEIILFFSGTSKKISGEVNVAIKEKDPATENPSSTRNMTVVFLVIGLLVMAALNVFWMLKKKR